jgi:ABC-type uncharacterized transport system YnjBCD ATPase subunit
MFLMFLHDFLFSHLSLEKAGVITALLASKKGNTAKKVKENYFKKKKKKGSFTLTKLIICSTRL